MIKKLCANSLTEEKCTTAEAINHKVSKCVYDKTQKKWKEEKKLCYEIEDRAKKDICSNTNLHLIMNQILAKNYI